MREQTLVDSILRNANVVHSTLNGAGSKYLKSHNFDVVIIDEASQALEAECWIPILKGKQLVLAGDHLQLPPTIKSHGDVAKNLELTLFERVLDLHGKSIKTLLNVQYRMNEAIMKFSSNYFYDGKLVSGPRIGDRILTDINEVETSDWTTFPVFFIDTHGFDFEETSTDDESKENLGEAECALKVIEMLASLNVATHNIAVISPYDGQVRLFKSLLKSTWADIEVGTVDGFQGREKEAVIISTVRSNGKGEVGFLAESRRMNVALTRPKRLLCVIGDSKTLSRNEFLKKMVNYMEENGELRQPDMLF